MSVAKIPVVIGTNPERTGWLKDCLASIRATSRNRQVLVHRTGGYEITALRHGMEQFDSFLFLHDSCEILSPDFWAAIDNCGPTWLFGGPPMYLGVYDSRTLAPAIEGAPPEGEMSKQWALAWENAITDRLTMPTLWPDVTDATGRLEDRHGRQNLILENHLLRKAKGHWGQGGPDL